MATWMKVWPAPVMSMAVSTNGSAGVAAGISKRVVHVQVGDLERQVTALHEDLNKVAALQDVLSRHVSDMQGLSKRLPVNVPGSPRFWSNKLAMQQRAISELQMKIAHIERQRSGTLLTPVTSWQQQSFQKHAGHSFVLFSSYRMDSRYFVAMGFGLLSHHNHRTMGLCSWTDTQGHVRQSVLRTLYPLEHHELLYEVVLLFCGFEKDVPPGGFLEAAIDHEDVVLHREEEGAFPGGTTAAEPFPSRLTVCCTPIHGKSMSPRRIREFVEYHRLLGADHFEMYDAGGVDDELRAAFAADLAAGTIVMTPFQGTEKYQSWYHGQLLAQHDCFYRSRYRARWVLVADFDEYIWPRNTSGVPLLDFLDRHNGTSVVTHGASWFDIARCRPPAHHELEVKLTHEELEAPAGAADGEGAAQLHASADLVHAARADRATRGTGEAFGVEQFSFRWPKVCFRDDYDPKYCPLELGHRKYFADPRLVLKMGIHGNVERLNYPPSTHHLSTDVLVHAHFQGFVSQDSVCTERFPLKQPIDWWVVDTSFITFARSLRADHVCTFSGPGAGCQMASPTSAR